jgi:hypothetical protein
MEIVLLIGAAEYALEEADARWLEKVIRANSVDVFGRAWDREARAALQIADVIAEDLEDGHSPEPIRLGRTSGLGLLVHSFYEGVVADVHAHVARSDGLAALYLALRRFARDAA